MAMSAAMHRGGRRALACLFFAVCPPIMADTYSGGTQNEPRYFEQVPEPCQGLAERYREQTRELHATAEKLRDTTFPASQAVNREIKQQTRERQVTRDALDACKYQASTPVPGLSPPLQGILDPRGADAAARAPPGALSGRVEQGSGEGPPNLRAERAGLDGADPGRADPVPGASVTLSGGASAVMAPDRPPESAPRPPARRFSSPERVVGVRQEQTRTITTRIRVDINDFDLHDGDYETSARLDGNGDYRQVHGTVERANQVFIARELTDARGNRVPLSRPVRMPLSPAP